MDKEKTRAVEAMLKPGFAVIGHIEDLRGNVTR
jgi:hypothetical protein